MADGTRSTDQLERWIIAISLAAGAIFGLLGSMFDSASSSQNVMYAISDIGIIAGATLLGVRHVRSGDMLVAAGMLLLAVAGAVVAAGGPADKASFAAGTMIYFTALILVALSEGFPMWARAASALSGIAFGVHMFRFLTGTPVGSESKVAVAGYILLTVAIIGWIISTLRSKADAS